MWSVSASEVYYWCISMINCTGKNASREVLKALGTADANMYLCSKELRPSKNNILYLLAVRVLSSVQQKFHFFVSRDTNM